MNISTDNPPHNIRELCEEVFDLTNVLPMWTFGDTIYNPHHMDIDKAQLVHEAVHTKQQGEKPAEWWDRYLSDAQFRFDEEALAYHAQYRLLNEILKDRNQLARLLHILAADLAGPMYGKLSTHQEARALIKKGVVK